MSRPYRKWSMYRNADENEYHVMKGALESCRHCEQDIFDCLHNWIPMNNLCVFVQRSTQQDRFVMWHKCRRQSNDKYVNMIMRNSINSFMSCRKLQHDCLDAGGKYNTYARRPVIPCVKRQGRDALLSTPNNGPFEWDSMSYWWQSNKIYFNEVLRFIVNMVHRSSIAFT